MGRTFKDSPYAEEGRAAKAEQQAAERQRRSERSVRHYDWEIGLTVMNVKRTPEDDQHNG